MVDGPRRVRADELEQLSELVDAIFFGREAGTMFEQFPRLFGAEHLERMRVISVDGRVVAHVGMVLESASILGCQVGIATIGAVCCEREHRQNGYGTALMLDAVALAREAGAAVMMISGGRGLYRRLGAANAGCYLRYEVAVGELPPADPSLELATVAPGRGEVALRLQEAEPVRWRRTAADYDAMLGTGVVACRLGSTHLVRRGGEPVAAATVSIRHDREHSTARLDVAEAAGSRAAVLGVLPRLAAQYGATHVRWPAYPCDAELRHLAARLGWRATPCGHEGTLKILNWPRLMEDCRPLLAERVGPDALAELSFEPEDDGLKLARLTILRGDERATFEGDAVVRLAFGSPEPSPPPAGPLEDLLRRMFPLPLPMYGLNYA